MASNFRSSKKKAFLRPINITPSIIMITGGVLLVINFLNLGIITLTTPEAIMILFLGLLAVDAFIAHSKEFEDIKSVIEGLKEELKKEKGYEFITNIDVVWTLAIEMINEVEENGYIYDSSSIKNRLEYEDAIEEKCQKGIEVKRLIASSNHQISVKDFIRPPQNYKNSKSKDCISVHHLPYSIPFDVLITCNRDKIRAIIGFKTSKTDDNKYTSALSITDRYFAKEIESIFKNELIPNAKKI